ncbi:MAG: hypothetical protein AAGJ73_13385 [Pseudomonadota bacterium]
MGQVCPKAEKSPPSGLARRSEAFKTIAARGGAYQGQPLSRLDLTRAAFQGTPELSDGARCLLGFYLSHLDTTRLGEGSTSVWPGNAAAGAALGKKDSTIRRLKGELEHAGFLIRKYDRRNRPLDGDAIDLSPFLAQTPDILRALDERNAARRGAWKEARRPDQETQAAIDKSDERRRSILSGDPPEFERLNSTGINPDSCLGFEDFGEREPADSLPPPSAVSMAKQQLLDAKVLAKALDLSPSLTAALDPDGGGICPQQAAHRIWAALPGLFPDDSAGSIGHTFLWCAKRHGAKSFLFLAVALEDPTAKDRRKLFGWFATHPEQIDLTRNIARIRHKPKPIDPADDTPKLPADPFEREIAEIIADEMGAPAYNSWLAPQSVRFTVKGDHRVRIEHESKIARKYLIERYGSALARAAERLGYRGYTVKEPD